MNELPQTVQLSFVMAAIRGGYGGGLVCCKFPSADPSADNVSVGVCCLPHCPAARNGLRLFRKFKCLETRLSRRYDACRFGIQQ